MFLLRKIQLIPRYTFLIITLVMMAACDEPPAIEPIVTSEPDITVTSHGYELTPQMLDSATSGNSPTVTPDLLATMVPTVVIKEEAINVSEPCGLLLPLAPKPVSVVNDLNGSAIPDGVVPVEALPALERLIEAPETVGLAAFELGRESEGVYLNADSPMPLASVVKIVNLIAYANAAADGKLDPGSWVLLSDLEKFYLPGLDLGAHQRGLRNLEERSLVVGDPPSTPLEEVPGMMIQHSSNAASDYIHLAVGQEELERTVLALGMTSHTAPCPWIGQFLVMSNHDRSESDWAAMTKLVNDPSTYGREVMRLTLEYANDPNFRAEEVNSRSRASGANVQALFADNLNSQASAGDYAQLMAKILLNGLDTSYVNILVRRALEWPMQFPANQEQFSTLGYKNGMLPGVLTTAYYAQRLEDGSQVVVVLFYRQLPMRTYRQWRRSLPHDELARWLLSDPDAIPALRQLVQYDR